MNSRTEYFSKLLNLKSSEAIGQELADRQLNVIVKGYQYLSEANQNVFYVADEVGLGKTYIAAGIALLFRHFSTSPQDHKDLIIVPQKNLQVKWKKELSNFVKKNYLVENPSLLKQYTRESSVKERVRPINEHDPLTIFRMTSFSGIAMRKADHSKLFDYLVDNIFNGKELAREVLTKARSLKMFENAGERSLKNLVAYLLNIYSSPLNCVIIDEAHNYKYGPGDGLHHQSIRNETTARFLGAIRDKELLKDFPELEEKIKFPLAQKVICLSATPKDRNLLEIKNQLSCFTNQHLLSEVTTNREVEPILKKFLVRGNLKYILKGKTVSRNKCKYEHRKGNVNKNEKAKALVVEDTFESVFWQLIQYQSIKQLSQKNNASFEIGMLAGFETYNTDVIKKRRKEIVEAENEAQKNESKEYEQIKHRRLKKSQDVEVVKGIVESYLNQFKSTPPHPKQSKLEAEIVRQLSLQDKSLIFVRRIGTVYELERRLLDQYEKEIVIKMQLKYLQKDKRFRSDAINKLIKSHEKKAILENLDVVFEKLLNKAEINDYLTLDDDLSVERKLLWLRIAYLRNTKNTFGRKIEDYLKRGLSNVSTKLRKATLRALKSTKSEFENRLKEKGNDDQEIEDGFDNNYFFHAYFKQGEDGYPYKQKIYRELWFDINPIQLNRHFKFLEFGEIKLQQEIAQLQFDKNQTKRKRFTASLNACYAFLTKNGKLKMPALIAPAKIEGSLGIDTFITKILCEHCYTEMQTWLARRMKNDANAITSLLEDLKVLSAILLNVFRNGSGLLPGYLVDQSKTEFDEGLIALLSNQESPFHFILKEIKTILIDFELIVQLNFADKNTNRIDHILRNLSPVIGTSGRDSGNKGILAARFRMPGFPYVMVTTDIFREGEDLHLYCQNVYHYGIAWNPSDMQQRTGRIDRINSLSYRKLIQTQENSFDHKIQVFYPYLTQSVEVNQVVQLFRNLNKFILTFNDITRANNYETEVAISDEILGSEIPPQIEENLDSKYDIDDF